MERSQIDSNDDGDRTWTTNAVKAILAETSRAGETPLIKFPTPSHWHVDLYLKDESRQPTGSLKHRLARSLFLYALCNGWLKPGMRVVEASSGSTAISEAYYAKLIGLEFVAVVPSSTSSFKVEQITKMGGEVFLVDDPALIRAESEAYALKNNGVFLDQFTYAERALEWIGSDNLAASTFHQLRDERFSVPKWVILGAGTGGTSTLFGRHCRRQGYQSLIGIADPEGSAYSAALELDDRSIRTPGSIIEGIGRPTVEPSFTPELVDSILTVPNSASIAGMRFLSDVLGQQVGGSTGTAFWASYQKMKSMKDACEEGSVLTVICDAGQRYADTYYDDAWLTSKQLDIAPFYGELEAFFS